MGKLVTAVVLPLALCAAPLAFAGEEAGSADRTRLDAQSTFNLRVDNDLFGGLNQDQGYSNGFLASWVSPNLVDYVGDPGLPRIVRFLNRRPTRSSATSSSPASA